MEHKYEKIVSILSTASLWNIFSFKYLASAVRDESKKKKVRLSRTGDKVLNLALVRMREWVNHYTVLKPK